MNIEEKILKYLYAFFPDIRIFPSGNIPLEDIGLDPLKDALEFQKSFVYLIENGYIKTKTHQISIAFHGIVYYEEKYLKSNYYFVNAIIILLTFLEKLENGEYSENSIPNLEIIKELEKIGVKMSNKKFFQFLITLEHQTDLFKNISSFHMGEQDKILTYENNQTILTPFGRKFLNDWRKQSNLFLKIVDPLQKKILLEEYNETQKCIQQGSWKDACVKIGGILEYLLTKWFQNKSLTPSQITNSNNVTNWNNVKFYQMIDFYMNNSMKYSDEIGTYTDWNLVKNILKDYRNYVHLIKYEERVKIGNFLRKQEFDRIYPIFMEIIKKF